MQQLAGCFEYAFLDIVELYPKLMLCSNTTKSGVSTLLHDAKHYYRAKVNFFCSQQTEQINLPSCVLSFWPETSFFYTMQIKINSAKSACQIKERAFYYF